MECSLGKNPENYESIRDETNIYEQKPINVDDFNEVKEKEVKERIEKRKQKRQEVAKKNKLLKKKKKKKQQQEETKIKERDMWKRLSQLNDEFKEIKKSKKDTKKMSDTIKKP